MIDFSNEIFNVIATELRNTFEDIKVVGEYVASPTSFPTVTIDETRNLPVHLDSAPQSKYAEVTYRVQVFSNFKYGKRAQARGIFFVLDAKMQEMGLFAVTYTTTPAIYNSEVYSITATYRGVIDIGGTIYRA